MKISRTIWVLSLVSLFTDTASEMLYPILPIYLQQIGFSIIIIGFLEGLAEATAGFSKGYFGKLSDDRGRRLPFVQIGYTLSAISKPMLALFVHPVWIFFSRTLDRFGKGIRTGARDAIISDEATPETKGKIFGFHRAWDTLGAAIGPAFALLYLYYNPEDYITLFYIAFIPGMLAVLFTFLLKENKTLSPKPKSKNNFFSFLKYWKQSSAQYRKVVTGLLLFALFNSSDVFLLLKAKEIGFSDSSVIALFIFYNLVYALFAYPFGKIADRVGLKRMFVIGLVLFALVYFVLATSENFYLFLAMFFIYGLYAAATQGISKAWISNIAAKDELATAIGTYSALQSICLMLASSIAGLIWYKMGADITFYITAVATVFVAIYFSYFVKKSI